MELPVKKSALSFVLLLTSPAFAQIMDVQKNSNFACTSSPCTVTLNTQPTATHNLIAVWTFWQSASTRTATVTDSPGGNPFVSAVGPTLQSASSTPITAQIFYAKNIQGSGIGHNDQIIVTFSLYRDVSGDEFWQLANADGGLPRRFVDGHRGMEPSATGSNPICGPISGHRCLRQDQGRD